MKELLGSQRTSRIDSETLTDILKPQAVLRILSDTILGGSTTFCGLSESIKPPASTAFER